MKLQVGARLLLLLWVISCGYAQIKRYKSIVDVTNGGTWGDWAWPEMCPDGYFASGFSIKVKKAQTWVWGRVEMYQIAELRTAIPSSGLTFFPPYLGGAASRHSWR